MIVKNVMKGHLKKQKRTFNFREVALAKNKFANSEVVENLCQIL